MQQQQRQLQLVAGKGLDSALGEARNPRNLYHHDILEGVVCARCAVHPLRHCSDASRSSCFSLPLQQHYHLHMLGVWEQVKAGHLGGPEGHIRRHRRQWVGLPAIPAATPSAATCNRGNKAASRDHHDDNSNGQTILGS
jgi:hypothetical protein